MFKNFLENASDFVTRLIHLEKNLNEEYFINSSFESLKKQNDNLFYEITMEGYKNSYLNPDYACEVFGKNLGQIAFCLYSDIFHSIRFVFTHEIENLLELKALLEKLKAQSDQKEAIMSVYREYKVETIRLQVSEFMGDRYNTSNDFVCDLI